MMRLEKQIPRTGKKNSAFHGRRGPSFGAVLALAMAFSVLAHAEVVPDVERPKANGGLRFFPSSDVFSPCWRTQKNGNSL